MNNKKWLRIVFSAAVAITLAGCDGISGTGGPSRGNDGDQPGKQTPGDGQAVLGPIVGATVTINDIEDINTTACSATTTDNNDVTKAGTISFDEACVLKDHLYLVTVAGGNDIDYDDDGNRDATPTPNTGEFRALLSGEQLLQNDWKTNALTETAYQAVQYVLQQGGANISAALDGIAVQLLREDLNGDGVINRLDIALWHPVVDADAAFNLDKLRDTAQLIHQNRNRTLAGIPIADALVAHIDTLAPARQVLTYGDRILVTTDSALLVYSKNNSGWQFETSLALGWVYDMAMDDNTLYVALGDNGIAAITFANGSPTLTKRWPIASRRITTLNTHVVFSHRNDNGGLDLHELNGDGASLIASSDRDYVDKLRSYSSDDAARNGVLKTLGDAIYWSSRSGVRRLGLASGTWVEQRLTNDMDVVDFNITDDIEVRDNTAYVVARTVAPYQAMYMFDDYRFYGAPIEQQFDAAMRLLDYTRTVKIYDISDINNPQIVDTVQNEDIAAIRRWDNVVVALGEQHISVRNPVDLQADAQFTLPASFSGFDPVHGLARSADLVVVAARENGVLFLTPPATNAHGYRGKVVVESALRGATISVQRVSDNVQVCSALSGDDGTLEISSDCLAEPGYYLLSATGGSRDVNGIATAFLGKLRAVMHSNDIARLNWTLSPLTEIALRVAQFGDGDGDRDGNGVTAFVRARDEIADWLIAGTYTSYQDQLLHTAQDLVQLPADAALDVDAQRWQNAVTELGNGTLANETVHALMAPVNALLTYDGVVTDVVSNDSATFAAHNATIDITDRRTQPWRRYSLDGGADQLHLSGDRLLALNQTTGHLDIYSVAAPDHAESIASTTVPGFVGGGFAAPICLAGNVLYQISQSATNTVDGKISAWQIGAATATPIIEANFENISPTFTFDWNLSCTDTALAVAAAFGNRLDVFGLHNGNLQRTTLIAPGITPLAYSSILGATLQGDTLYLFQREDDGDHLKRYEIANDSTITLDQDTTLTSEYPNNSIVLNPLIANDRVVGVVTRENISLFDAQSLQPLATKPLTFSALLADAGTDALWLWGIGSAVWEVEIP